MYRNVGETKVHFRFKLSEKKFFFDYYICVIFSSVCLYSKVISEVYSMYKKNKNFD